MTLLELNALGYYLSSLSQTKDLGKFGCTVRPCTASHWYGHAEGATSIEEALSVAYEHALEMQIFGRSKRQIKLSMYDEPPKHKGPELSLESLGFLKPLKRRSLSARP